LALFPDIPSALNGIAHGSVKRNGNKPKEEEGEGIEQTSKAREPGYKLLPCDFCLTKVSPLKVDGWLAADGVSELVRVLESATAPVRLLARDLRGADEAGVSVLRRLADEGTPLEGLSTYLQLLLAVPASLDSSASSSLTSSETPVRSNGT
jgi:hypothetical protein